MMETTRKCPVCGRAYKVFAMSARDQSACHACEAEANAATQRPDTWEQRSRRNRFWSA